jgi:hypothetical protein
MLFSHVVGHVKHSASSSKKMKACSSRQFVHAPVPSAHAGVARALRHAFPMDAPAAGLKPFEELLTRLDRAPPRSEKRR